MKKSKAISRAAQRLDTPALPYGFNARLMTRVRERAHEQRRTDIITGIAASVAIIAMVAYGTFAMMKVELPKIDWAAMFDDMMMTRMRLWGMMMLTVVAMFVADMYIRQYFRLRKIRKNEKGGQ